MESANPFFTAPSNKKRITLVGLYVAVIGSIMQSSTLSIMLPVAAQEIGGIEYYSLANTVTGVVSIAAMPLWGYIGTRSPAAKVPLFAASLAAGVVCLIGRAFAPSMAAIIVASIPYGLLSAGIFVLGYSIIRDMFEPKMVGTYLGLCGTMMSAGMLVGPVLGGFIMDTLGWRWVCHLIWVVLVVAMVLVLSGVHISKEDAAAIARTGGAFDVAGTVSLMVLLSAVILALSLGTSYLPFGGLPSNVVFAVALVALVALAAIVRRKRERAVIPSTALKNRNVVCLALANFCSMFSNMAVFFFLPLYMVTGMGLSATESGIATTLYSVLGLVMGPIFGRAIGKSGTARGVLSFGITMRIVVAAAFLLYLSPNAPVFGIYVIMFFAGFYSSAHSTSFSAGPQIQIPASVRVQGNSVVQMGQNLGGAVGTAF